VVESGRKPFQGAVEQQLPRGAEQQVRAAHNLGNSHRGVVHDAGQLVGGDFGVAPDDEVAEVSAGDELLRAEVLVHKEDHLAVGHAEAPVDSMAGGARRGGGR